MNKGKTHIFFFNLKDQNSQVLGVFFETLKILIFYRKGFLRVLHTQGCPPRGAAVCFTGRRIRQNQNEPPSLPGEQNKTNNVQLNSGLREHFIALISKFRRET